MPPRILSRMVQVPHNGEKVPAFLSRPAGAGPFPGVVVIQEWWGLEPHIKNVASRFAREGFCAIAPDLYHGRLATEPDEAEKLMMALNMEQAVREIISSARYLRAQSYCSGKVATVGFCMGGSLSFLTACRSAGLTAAVVFYGRAPDPPDQVKHLECPLLGIFAELDTWLTPQMVRETEARLRDYGKDFEFHMYPGVDHAFFNDTKPLYHRESAEDAWRKTLAFLRRHLL